MNEVPGAVELPGQKKDNISNRILFSLLKAPTNKSNNADVKKTVNVKIKTTFLWILSLPLFFFLFPLRLNFPKLY